MPTLRSPARSPSPPQTPGPNDFPSVNIHHPGYKDRTDTLLSLAPVDVEERADGSFARGVQFHAVHTACAIIANNRFDGWISLDKAGMNIFRRALPEDEILVGGKYWFHVPKRGSSGTDPYPVVPTFRHWTFPNHLPRPFSNCLAEPLYTPPGALPPVTAIHQRDLSCRLTAAVDSTERAHLIPHNEKDWFGANNMARFARSSAGRDAVDSQYNGLLLREDIHSLYDRMGFSLIPKADYTGVWRLAAHVHNLHSPTVFKAYHNQVLRPVKGVVPEYLLARFAWDIFPQVRAFLQGNRHRRLAVLDANGNRATRWHTGEECRDLCEGQGKGRSTSPSKRKRDDMGRNEGGGGDGHSAELAAPRPDSGVSGLDGGNRASDRQIKEEESLEEQESVEEQVEGGGSRSADNELAAEAEQELAAQNLRRARRIREYEEDFGGAGGGGMEGVQEEPHRGRKRRRQGSCSIHYYKIT